MADPILRRFRLVALAEGISFLVLVCIAMPIKYAMHIPSAVRWPGMVHGVLFIAYIVRAVPLFTRLHWPSERIYGVALASVLPFGTFVLERKWLRGN